VFASLSVAGLGVLQEIKTLEPTKVLHPCQLYSIHCMYILCMSSEISAADMGLGPLSSSTRRPWSNVDGHVHDGRRPVLVWKSSTKYAEPPANIGEKSRDCALILESITAIMNYTDGYTETVHPQGSGCSNFIGERLSRQLPGDFLKEADLHTGPVGLVVLRRKKMKIQKNQTTW
jgi:hypothetical protein